MSDRMIRIAVVEKRRGEDGIIEFGSSYEDGTLDKVIASLQKAREMIPVRYRDKARCEINCVNEYGDRYASIEIVYLRPYDDDEVMEPPMK